MYVAASVVDSLDPMFPYVQYYDLANSSIDTFVKIRSLNDMFDFAYALYSKCWPN